MHVRVCIGFEESLRSRFCAVYIFVVVITICLSELMSCVEVEVAVLGFPSLIIHTVSENIKQH